MVGMKTLMMSSKIWTKQSRRCVSDQKNQYCMHARHSRRPTVECMYAVLRNLTAADAGSAVELQ
jgi:hypothetical protein